MLADMLIDIDAELAKLEEELTYTKGFLLSVQKKLSNERFVNNAPAQVVASEKKKEADALAKIDTLETSLSNLR
jgi:valyl-tRNA synthetase